MAAPINNRGGRKSDKHWRDALLIAVKRTADETTEVIEDPKAPMLAKAAAACVLAAARGDKDAYREVGDRLDGKPKQQTELSGPEGEAIPIGIRVRFAGRPEPAT